MDFIIGAIVALVGVAMGAGITYAVRKGEWGRW